MRDFMAIRVVGPPTRRTLYINGQEIHGVRRVSVDFDDDSLSEVTVTLVTDEVTVEPVVPE